MLHRRLLLLAGLAAGLDCNTARYEPQSDLPDAAVSPDGGSVAAVDGAPAPVDGARAAVDGGLPPVPPAAPPGSPATRLVFAFASDVAYTRTPLPSLQVRVEDAERRTVTSDGVPVSIAIGKNPGGSNLVGFANAATVAGVATFASLGLDKTGVGYTLVASAPGLPAATSAGFEVKDPPWSRVATGLYGGIIRSVAVAPGSPATVYAATGAGVFKSSNNGGSWVHANFGNSGEAGLVVVDPKNPSTVYITADLNGSSLGLRGFSFAGKSENAGEAWRAIGEETRIGNVGNLVVDPLNPALLYAGSAFGLYRSTTAGEVWQKTSFPFACYALAIDPVTPTTLYAHAYDQENFKAQGIYKSVDSAATWKAINTGLTTEDLRLGFLLATPTAVLATTEGAKVFRSADGGARWSTVNATGGPMAYAPSRVMRVYLGTQGAVRVSNDGGATFGSPATVGAPVNWLAVDPAIADLVYAATDNGVYVSTDGGGRWAFSSSGIAALNVGSVALHPTQPNIMFAGTADAIFRTSDGGVTWSRSSIGVVSGDVGPPRGAMVSALAIDRASPSTVYACAGGAQFYRSLDGGTSWSDGIDTGGGSYCSSIVVRGQTLWVPTVGGGVRRSTNRGDSWSATGLTVPTYGLDADRDGRVLYAGTNAGTYKSIDAGMNWTKLVAADLAGAMLVDPTTPSTVYAGMSCGSGDGGATGSGGIKRSLDAGVAWAMPADGPCVNAMAALPGGPIVAVGRDDLNRFAVSSDHGGVWQRGGLGIQGEPSSVAAAADGRAIFVGTNLGLFKSVTGGL